MCAWDSPKNTFCRCPVDISFDKVKLVEFVSAQFLTYAGCDRVYIL